MKTNYTLKNIKKGIAIVAILTGFTSVNAQTLVPQTGNIRTPTANTVYSAGPLTITSSTISMEGTTFQLQATLTPNSTLSDSSAFIQTQGNNRYGVDGTSIDGDKGESIAISDLTVVNFDAGVTAYTAAAVQDIYFAGVVVNVANHADDQIQFTIVGGSSPGVFNIGKAGAATIEFGVEYTNGDGAVFTVGSETGVTGYTIENGSELATDSFRVVGSNWSLNFAKEDPLSINDIDNDSDNELTISPNPVNDVISLNVSVESAQIIDLTGRAVANFAKGSNEANVSALLPGSYILKAITTEGNVITKQFIKK